MWMLIIINCYISLKLFDISENNMKVVIQRVKSASVSIDEDVISSIGKGICVLVGIHVKDTPKERETIVRKLLNLRIFEDDQNKRWSKSVKDLNLEILCVSQF